MHNASKAFTPDALKRCAARVAAGSGDVRKALQLCRRAVELCQAEPLDHKMVQGTHLDRAAKELLYSNPAAQAIAGLDRRGRYFLCGVLLELRSEKGTEVVSLRKVAARYEKLVRTGGGSICQLLLES